ncbi:MAG: M15 family metallopeptidase, partial [Promicromonosporaceae bacterium]|nr:M15 family metallopeptidase [Promicromonosporaceae bacterium]
MGHSGSKANRVTRWVSLAAVAAVTTAGTINTTTAAAPTPVFAEMLAITSEVPAVIVESRADIASRTVAASRSVERVGISESLTEGLDQVADRESVDAVLEVLDYASLVLEHERRAAPEVAIEIREAMDAVHEALYLFNTIVVHDDITAVIDAVVASDSPVVAEIFAESALVNDAADLTEISELSYEPELFAELESLGYDLVSHSVERLEIALLESELSVPLVQPRPLTAVETIAALIAEAQADGARLHEAYAYAFASYGNGRIPDAAMTNLSWQPDHQLRPDAAAQFERLNEAFRIQFGVDIHITSSYRTFAGQVSARARHGHWAATPGTSNHGWGVAVDLAGGINRFRSEQHRWMRENAPAFGWILPEWAQERGNLPEPWHWE